jgi:hypothetical protein
MRRWILMSVVPVALLIFEVQQASAQGANAEMVRKDLLLALLATDRLSPMTARASIPPDVLIGSTTSDVERELTLPRGSELLGTITRDASTEVLALVPLEFDSARVAIQRALEEKGWQTPQPQTPPQPRGGFVSPATRLTVQGMLCKGRESTAVLLVAPVAGRPRTSFARVVLQSQTGFCSQQQQQRQRSMENPFDALPPLHPPSGTAGWCVGGGGRSSSGTSTRIDTSLPANELVAHYGRQLEAAGWRPAPLSSNASGMWTKPDTAGALETHITVNQAGTRPGCYEARLNVSRY